MTGERSDRPSLERPFDIRIAACHLGGAVLVGGATLTKDNSLLIRAPEDATFGVWANQSVHGSGLQHTKFERRGIDDPDHPRRSIERGGGPRHQVRGVRHVNSHVCSTATLARDYRIKANREGRRHTLVVEEVDLPAAFAIQYYDVQPGRADLAQRVIDDPFAGIGRCVAHTVYKAGEPWLLVKLTSLGSGLSVEAAVHLEIMRHRSRRKSWDPCPCDSGEVFQNCCEGLFTGMRPPRRRKALYLP